MQSKLDIEKEVKLVMFKYKMTDFITEILDRKLKKPSLAQRGANTTTSVNVADTPPTSTAAPATLTVAVQSPDSILTNKKKRRLIQLLFELLGSPLEFNELQDNQWEGPTGIINTIKTFCGFTSWRSREQIRNVMEYVSNATINGENDVDAGIKVGATRSGRKQKLSHEDNVLVAKSLSAGLGVEMTWEILNQKRLKNGSSTVDEITVRRAAHNYFSGVCHNRPLCKTGSKDKNRYVLVCVCRYYVTHIHPTPTLFSKWAKTRYWFGLQLQQQFREGDVPGVAMVGTTVVKLFDDTVYVGKIIVYDTVRKWYKVRYTDGDEEELTFRELRVRDWKQIPRCAVLWLDEKVAFT